MQSAPNLHRATTFDGLDPTTAHLDQAEALRRALRDLVEEREYIAPYYWAGFVLSGAGR